MSNAESTNSLADSQDFSGLQVLGRGVQRATGLTKAAMGHALPRGVVESGTWSKVAALLGRGTSEKKQTCEIYSLRVGAREQCSRSQTARLGWTPWVISDPAKTVRRSLVCLRLAAPQEPALSRTRIAVGFCRKPSKENT